MPTTPNGLRYPDPSEAVRDGALRIRDLAEDVDSKFSPRAAVSRLLVAGGDRWAFLGDSITNGSNSVNASVASYPAATARIVGTARMNYVEHGEPGENASLALGRLPAILATVPAFTGLYVQLGTNDASQNRTVEDFSDDIISIVNAARAAGVVVVVGLVPPRGTGGTAALQSRIRAYNTWLRAWAPTVGVLLADTYSALADPVTGAMAAAYDDDGTHPNAAGHLRMARAVAPILAGLIPDQPWPLGGADNLLGAWGDGGGTASRSFSTEPASVFDPLPRGSWDVMQLTGNGFGILTATIDPADYSAGEMLRVWLYVRGGDSVDGYPGIQVTSNGAPLSVIDGIGVARPGPQSFDQVATADAMTLRIVGSTTGTPTDAAVGAATVLNLTRLGLA